MRPLILGAIFCLAGSAASAAPVVVRSGEHDGFTRLVLQLPAGAIWSLGQTAGGYLLRAEGGDIDYDVSKTFDYIGRGRIARIEAADTPGALRLELACPCHATASETPAGLLVLDVVDGTVAVGPDQPPPEPVGEENALDLSRFWLRQPHRGDPNAGAADRFADGGMHRQATDHSRLGAAARLLEWQVSRAMGQGLVEAAEKAPAAKLLPLRPGRRDGPDMPAPVELGLAASTARDQNIESAAPRKTAATCPDPSDFAVRGWADDRPFALQIADVTAGLVGEFDATDREQVLKAARFYLHFGLGAEAVRLVRGFGIGPEDDRWVAALAEIVEGSVRLGNPLISLECDGDAVLWHVLADPAALSAGNTPAILAAFSGLPVPLRNVLGPRLGDIFLAAGQPQMARAVRDAMARASDDDGEVSMMDVEIGLADQGRQPDPAALVSRLARQGENTARSVILAVEAYRRRGLAVPAEVSELAEALAFENRSGSFGAELRRAHARALASQGRFVEAFAQVDGAPDRAASLPPDLFEMLAANADDGQFVQVIFDRMAQATAPQNVAQWNAIGTRLVDLGFPQQAGGFLHRPVQSEADHVLAARIAIAEGRKDSALEEIRGLKSEEAAALREALHSSGGGQAASVDGSAAPAAQTEDGAGDHSAGPAGVLEATRALIAQSRADRKSLEALVGDAAAP